MITRCRRSVCHCHEKLVRLITKQQIYTSLEPKAQARMQDKINLPSQHQAVHDKLSPTGNSSNQSSV